MSNEHTAGPWFVRRDMFRDPGTVCVLGTVDLPEGRKTINVTCMSEDTDAPEVVLANANLIAAAPDLLAALEALADAPFLTGQGVYVREVQAAETAIAKARGEKPETHSDPVGCAREGQVEVLRETLAALEAQVRGALANLRLADIYNTTGMEELAYRVGHWTRLPRPAQTTQLDSEVKGGDIGKEEPQT